MDKIFLSDFGWPEFSFCHCGYVCLKSFENNFVENCISKMIPNIQSANNKKINFNFIKVELINFFAKYSVYLQ